MFVILHDHRYLSERIIFCKRYQEITDRCNFVIIDKYKQF